MITKLVTVLAILTIGGALDMAATIEPGGFAGFHSHKDRPALSYIIKGALTEHRKGSPDRTYKVGEAITEGTDVDHWAENASSSEPVVIVSVDLFKE